MKIQFKMGYCLHITLFLKVMHSQNRFHPDSAYYQAWQHTIDTYQNDIVMYEHGAIRFLKGIKRL